MAKRKMKDIQTYNYWRMDSFSQAQLMSPSFGFFGISISVPVTKMASKKVASTVATFLIEDDYYN